MTSTVGAAVSTSEQMMAGFNASRTLTYAAIMGAIAHEDPFARALLRINPTFTSSADAVHAEDLAFELEAARTDFAQGRLDVGAARLMPFLAIEDATAIVLETLAEACLASERPEDALAIALRYLDGDPMNPRALRIAGECEIGLGNKKAAQAHLAKCARISRKLPDHIEDMRISQRLLLQIHFG